MHPSGSPLRHVSWIDCNEILSPLAAVIGRSVGNRVGEPKFGSTVPPGRTQVAFDAAAPATMATRGWRHRRSLAVCHFDERYRAALCAARGAATAAAATAVGGKWGVSAPHFA